MIILLISDDCPNNLDFVILTAKVLLEIDENLDENLTSLFTQVCKTDKMLTQEKGKYGKKKQYYIQQVTGKQARDWKQIHNLIMIGNSE